MSPTISPPRTSPSHEAGFPRVRTARGGGAAQAVRRRDGGQDRDALFRGLRAYVDANLWDRNLTPASVAKAQHISLRYLHKLFEGRGSTVGRWIRHRRLEEARRELARPGHDDVTVAAVARRWGFASAAHFSRSFRAAYGMSPSDWRDGRTRRTASSSPPPEQVMRHAARAGHDLQVEPVEQLLGGLPQP